MSTIATTLLFAMAVAQSTPTERPADLHPDATWPTVGQWADTPIPSFDAAQLVQVDVPDTERPATLLFARAQPYPDGDRLWLIGRDADYWRMERSCYRGCAIGHNDADLQVARRRGRRVDRRTLQAVHYAQVLRTFEGELYRVDALSEGPQHERRLDYPAHNDVDENAWVDQVLSDPGAVFAPQRAEASAMAARLGRHEDALQLGRLYRPYGMCSMDASPQYYALSLAEYARNAHHIGLAIEATLQSVDYWSVQAAARSSYGHTTVESTDWADSLTGVDLPLLIEGLVADGIDHPPALHWTTAQQLVNDAPVSIRANLILRLQRRTIDPWNQVLLLLVTGAAVQQDGRGFVAVWDVEPAGNRIDPLVAQVVLHLGAESPR